MLSNQTAPCNPSSSGFTTFGRSGRTKASGGSAKVSLTVEPSPNLSSLPSPQTGSSPYLPGKILNLSPTQAVDMLQSMKLPNSCLSVWCSRTTMFSAPVSISLKSLNCFFLSITDSLQTKLDQTRVVPATDTRARRQGHTLRCQHQSRQSQRQRVPNWSLAAGGRDWSLKQGWVTTA